jgi:HAMP domain-containing protein
MHKTIEKNYLAMSKILADSLAVSLDETVEEISMLANSILWKKRVAQNNLRYERMNKETRDNYFLDMDKKWNTLPEDNVLLRDFLDNEVSLRLRGVVKDDNDFAEIFITDKYGGLVSSSEKTSDFYQADEAWWQKAYNDGRGNIYLGEVELDQSSNTLSLTVAVPIKEGGVVIGVCKASIGIDNFLESLKNFTIGETGHASLANTDGYIIFHQGIVPMQMKYFPEQEWKDFVYTKAKQNWLIKDNLHQHKEKIFAVFHEITHPLLSEYNINWIIFIDQDVSEVFAPVRELILQMLYVMVILFICIILLALFLADIFIKPIEKLREATEHLGAGDLDYKVEIRSEDEMEQLADSLNNMAASLKSKTTSIDNLNHEITELTLPLTLYSS